MSEEPMSEKRPSAEELIAEAHRWADELETGEDWPFHSSRACFLRKLVDELERTREAAERVRVLLVMEGYGHSGSEHPDFLALEAVLEGREGGSDE